MMNLLARVGWETRVAEARGEPDASSARAMAGELVDYMLFVDEPPLPGACAGTSTFAERFCGAGPARPPQAVRCASWRWTGG